MGPRARSRSVTYPPPNPAPTYGIRVCSLTWTRPLKVGVCRKRSTCLSLAAGAWTRRSMIGYATHSKPLSRSKALQQCKTLPGQHQPTCYEQRQNHPFLLMSTDVLCIERGAYVHCTPYSQPQQVPTRHPGQVGSQRLETPRHATTLNFPGRSDCAYRGKNGTASENCKNEGRSGTGGTPGTSPSHDRVTRGHCIRRHASLCMGSAERVQGFKQVC
jgi:hypothetical protein